MNNKNNPSSKLSAQDIALRNVVFGEPPTDKTGNTDPILAAKGAGNFADVAKKAIEERNDAQENKGTSSFGFNFN